MAPNNRDNKMGLAARAYVALWAGIIGAVVVAAAIRAFAPADRDYWPRVWDGAIVGVVVGVLFPRVGVIIGDSFHLS